MLEEDEYDAIVSDYQMAEMDGLEFLEKVRGDRNSDIPFIIFTSKGREGVAIEALNLGPTGTSRREEVQNPSMEYWRMP